MPPQRPLSAQVSPEALTLVLGGDLTRMPRGPSGRALTRRWPGNRVITSP